MPDKKCHYCELSKAPQKDPGYKGETRNFYLLVDLTQELRDYGKILIVSKEPIHGIAHALPETQEEVASVAKKVAMLQRRIFRPCDQTIAVQPYADRGVHHLHAAVTPIHAERSAMQGILYKPVLRTLLDSYSELSRAVNLNEGDFERYMESWKGDIHAKLGSWQQGLWREARKARGP